MMYCEACDRERARRLDEAIARQEEREANQRLRDAAPELLKALKQAGILINSAPEIGLGRRAIMAQILEAIEKAEGK